MRKILMASLVALAASSPAIAQQSPQPLAKGEQMIELKDGSTLHIYKDGKMGMEDKYGKPATMKEGQAMQTKDGKTIMMKGNEVWRLYIHKGEFTN